MSIDLFGWQLITLSNEFKHAFMHMQPKRLSSCLLKGIRFVNTIH